MFRKTQSATPKQYKTARYSESLPTPEELAAMRASGLDPASGTAVREFRRRFQQKGLGLSLLR